MNEYQRHRCFGCNRVVEVDMSDHPMTISTAYSALWFRASGNYGSSVFDPMPIGVEEYLQIVICDDCVKKKIGRVTRIHNIKRTVTAESGEFTP